MRRLGEQVGGWKVGFSPEGGIFCAPIYASKVHAEPGEPAGATGFHADRHRVRDRLPPQPGAAGARPALQPRRGAGGVLAASDDRGRRFALSGFPLARPAAGARRQFLERRAGLRRRRLGLAGDGPRAPADRGDRRRQAFRRMHRVARRRPDRRCWSTRSTMSRTGAAACPPAPSSPPAPIPAWCSPSPASRSAPITARSARSRSRFRSDRARPLRSGRAGHPLARRGAGHSGCNSRPDDPGGAARERMAGRGSALAPLDRHDDSVGDGAAGAVAAFASASAACRDSLQPDRGVPRPCDAFASLCRLSGDAAGRLRQHCRRRAFRQLLRPVLDPAAHRAKSSASRRSRSPCIWPGSSPSTASWRRMSPPR